ncbi:MAG: ATP-binding cassette domain-containing protein [Opitutaceae bacterium]|nr:ATP-binding cassette domain-containing protein [Opitutaceae bacterium]
MIETTGLSGRPRDGGGALDITWAVSPGVRVALIGAEGAGKSALLRLLLNLDPIRAGTARVLGKAPARLSGATFARIGYVPQHHLVPLHLNVRQHLARWRGFYPTWDQEFALHLSVRLALPLDVRANHLERPLRLKAALLSSLAYRPDLLFMDGSFDQMEDGDRREVGAALNEALTPGRSVLIATARDAACLEGVCDHIAWLQEGRIQVFDRVDALMNQYRRITVTFAHPPGRLVDLPPEWILLDARGRRLHAVDTRFGDGATLRGWLATFPGATVEDRPMVLAEIGEALARRAAAVREGGAS